MRSSHLNSNDEEDNSVGNPGPLLVMVDEVVTHEGDTECQKRDDNNSHGNGKSTMVDSVEHLSRHDCVDCTPADTSDTVEKCKESNTLVSKPVSRKNHLSETKLGAEARVKGNGGHTENVEEDDGKKRVDEMQLENGDTKATESERSDNKVSGEPHGSGVPDTVVSLFLLRDSVDTSNLSLQVFEDSEEEVVRVSLDNVFNRAMARVFEGG